MKKSSLTSGLIALVGVLLSPLGEIMPQAWKDAVEPGVEQLGISFAWLWALVFLVLTGTLVRLTWRSAKTQTTTLPSSPRTVNQSGKKATYVEKNEGGIHIS